MANNRLNLLVNFSERGLSKLSGGLKTLVSVGEKGGDTFRRMASEARSLENELRDVRRELRGASGNVTELLDRERALERQVEQANEALRQRKALYKNDKQADAYAARGKDMRASGRDDIVRGVGMLAPLALAMKAGMDYDKQLALLAQKTDLNKEETKLFGAELLKVAANAKLVPDTVIGAADFLASKGLGVNELRAAMPAIATFGRAWDADVNDAAKASYANFLSLKVPLNQTARALEIMGVAGKEGGFEVKDMAQHFPMLASSLATYGAEGVESVSSLSAALQVLEAKTGDGSTAANDLNNLLRFAQTAQGQKNFRKFGIDIVAELKKAEREGGDSLERLAQLVDQATGGDDDKIADIISDTQAWRGALNLVTSIDKYREIRDAAFAAQGVTSKEFQRMSETASANWDEAKGSLSTLAVMMSANLLPTVTSGIKKFTGIVQAVSDWAEENPKTASTLLHIFAALAMANIAVGATKIAFGGLFSVLGGGLKYFGKAEGGVSRAGRHFKIFKSVVGGAASGAVKAFGLLRMGAMFLARGLLQAGLMMLANPIVLAIVAVIAVVGLLAWAIYANWDKIKAAWAKGMEWLSAKIATFKEWFAGLPDWMKTIGKSMMAGLLGAINPVALGAKLIRMAKNGITAFKSYLGIKSPSRLFMEYGGHIAGGLALGVDRDRDKAFASARRLAAGVAGAAAVSLSTPVAADSGASRPASSLARSTKIEIKIVTQPGQSADEIARAVRLELERIQREDDARDASAFGDY